MTTAIIKTQPGEDKAVIALLDEVTKIKEYSDRCVIDSNDAAKGATNDLSMMANLRKAIEEKRREFISPLQEHQKQINDAFKLLLGPLGEADQITRRKILDYRQEQERIRLEQEAINQQKIELAKREAALNQGEFTVEITPVTVIPEQPKHIRAEAGIAGEMMVRKWEVLDQSQVPDEYKIVDSAKIGKVVRAGIPGIPGIRIWEEPTLRVTAAK